MRMRNKREKSMSTHIFLEYFIVFFHFANLFYHYFCSIWKAYGSEMEINYHLEATNGTKEQFNMLTSMIDAYCYSLVGNEAVQNMLKNGGADQEVEEIRTYINDMVRMNDSINHVYILVSMILVLYQYAGQP